MALWSVALLGFASIALLAVACSDENLPSADEPMDEITSGFNRIDVREHTADLPFEIFSYWSAQHYIEELALLRDTITASLQSNFTDRGENLDLTTQNVIMFDMLISAPASEDLELIANLENSQFTLIDGDGMRYKTNTWVEAPMEALALDTDFFFEALSKVVVETGVSYYTNIDIVNQLIIHGRNVARDEFFEEPLVIPAGESLWVWLAHIVPLDADGFSLQFDDTIIPISDARHTN